MIKPYYEENGITIYHGDCREILPELEPVDLVLTDPPYGIGYIPRELDPTKRGGRGRLYERITIQGDLDKFDPTFLLHHKNLILWGANHYAEFLPSKASWLVWDKMGGNCKFHGRYTYSDCELAWCSDGKPARIFQHIWAGIVKQGVDGGKPRLHPNQKPLELIFWCINRFPEAITILDPFMGSGTTLVAAKQLGRKAIGIEIEEKYCEIAVKRLAQGVLDFAS